MTELTITPKVSDKTARFKGTIAAGEHVAVTIKGGSEWVGEDEGANLTLRVIDLVTKRTLAVFPRPPEVMDEGAEPDAWADSGEDLTCTLNLNTTRMVNAARHMLRVPVMFVLGDTDAPRTLYFRDQYEVEYWPERIGDDVPYDLDAWPKQIDEWMELVDEWTEQMEAWSTALAGKQDTISDLATIRAGAAKGATAIQSHQDISGKADLVGGKVPQSQLPSYVDDVLEFAAAANFPATGEEGKIYVAKDENKTYRWSGTQYVQIGGSDITVDSALSETSENPVQNRVVKEAMDARPTKERIEDGWWSGWTTVPGGPYQWTLAYDAANGEWVATSTSGDFVERMVSLDGENAVELTWGRLIEDVQYAATRHRVAAPVPTKTSDLANDGPDGAHPFISQNEVQHQQLAPVYSQTWTFSDPASIGHHWEVTSSGIEGTVTWTIYDVPNGGTIADGVLVQELQGPADADTIHFEVAGTTATRSVIGYTLGGQTTKPLQPQGNYAPATNIPKSALASDVQTSLGKADTAVQPAGIAGLMPMYALGATPTVEIASASLPSTAFPVQYVDINGQTQTVSSPASVTLELMDSASGWLLYAGKDFVATFNTDGTYRGEGMVLGALTFGENSTPPVENVSPVLDFQYTLVVSPYTGATYTAGSTAAAFEIAVGALPAGVAGKARDCILVIDCTATGAVAPTVTWGTHFHPRTDTETDLAIVEAGKRAVFYISEYATGEFAVGGWTETAGGNA